MKLSTVLLLALALAAPTSMAWTMAGSFEPDTQADVDDGFFFYTSDTDPNPEVKKVYFNAHISDGNSQGLATPNPNVGATQSRISAGPMMTFSAFLGVWKDCNGDGYLGLAETGQLHYLSQLLVDGDSICPAGTFFNRDGWVSEFWAIGPQEKAEGLTESDFPRVIHDGSARVWGDFGRVGVKDEIHFDCAQFPMQEGSGDSTGGLLLYFDCQLSYNVAKTMNANDPTPNKDLTWNYEGDGGQGYYHPERDCTHPLNVHLDTYGNDKCTNGDPDDVGLLETDAYCDSDEEASASCEDDGRYDAFRVWDCANYEESFTDVNPGAGAVQPEFANQQVNVTDEDGNVASVRNPPGVSPNADADGSLWDGWFALQDTDCSRGFRDGNGPGETVLSASFAGTNPADGKRMADFNMSWGNFGSGVLGNNPRDVEDNEQTNEDLNTLADDLNSELGEGTVPQLGVLPTDGILPDGVSGTAPTNFGLVNTRDGNWGANVIYLPPTFLGPTVRTSDFTKPSGGMFYTFYADFDASVTAYSAPTNNGGKYAAEPCESSFGSDMSDHTQDIRNGWECNAANWWLDFDIGNGVGQNGCHEFEETPEDAPEDFEPACVGYDDDPSPGDDYDIRDVDCYDGTLVGSVDGLNGVGAGLTLLDEDDGPCPTVELPE